MKELSLDISVKSPLHTKILDQLNSRYEFSANRMAGLHKKWMRAEDLFVAWTPEKDVDAIRRMQREQGGKPQYTTIILPYTYAQLMSAHSYWTTVFLGRNPIFQFQGRHGEAEMQVQALEALIAYQIEIGQMLPCFYFWLMDAGKYGLGVVNDYWCEEVRSISQLQEIEENILGMGTGQFKKQLVTEQIRSYYGNKLRNVRPYDYYPDTRVPLWDPQKGEFVSSHAEMSWTDLVLKRESGEYVNVDAFKSLNKGSRSTGRQPGSPRVDLPNDDTTNNAQDLDLADSGPYGVMQFEIKILPKMWGLSSVAVPEKWVFTCGITSGKKGSERGTNLGVVLEARPLGCYHDKFRYSILEMEPEAYGLASRGLPEVIEPLQNTMDWLVNSHMYAVRKTMNNQFYGDPSRIVMSDFDSPRQGGFIRATPAAYGTDITKALQQLPVVDLTRGHMQDLPTFDMFSQRASGVNEQMMGQVNSGGRKTAQEIRSSSTFGVNREKTICEFMGVMGWNPLAQRFVQNSQQYFDSSTKLRIVGDLAMEAGQNFLMVDPQAIAGFYDMIAVDGTMPIDRFAQANLWQQIFAQVARMPQVLMQYDMGRIFAWVAQLAGLKNINRFKIQVLPPGMQQPPPGSNVVPMKQALGNLQGVPQLPGMGTGA